MKFTKQSKNLIKFLERNKDNFNKVPKLDNKTKYIFLELYNNLIEAYNYLLGNNYKKQSHIPIIFKPSIEIKTIKKVNDITKPRTFNINSFPNGIINYINENMIFEIIYKFNLFERNYTIHFILENEENINIYNNYVFMIALWLYILNLYSSNKCAHNVVIYLYMTSLEKILPSSSLDILEQNNVNTAFTYSCPIDSEIVIYRREEWFKVFIHESFHNYGLDYSMMDNSNINKCISKLFNINSDINSFESYTEFWAEIINIVFISFYLSIQKQKKKEFEDNYLNFNKKKYFKNIEILINLEIKYSLFQLVKVLNFMDLTYENLIYSKYYDKSINLYREKSNVFSYYILKTLLLFNYQDFLLFCKYNNNNLLNFKKTNISIKKLCFFIKDKYKREIFLDNIKNFEELLNNYLNFPILQNISNINQKKIIKEKEYILSNLRMTICELG
jgi:hypothetical protein